MKRFFTYCLTLLLTISALHAEEQASAVVTRFLQKVEQQTLSSAFSMTISDQASQPLTTTGTIKMRGERFLLNMLDYEAAYDGTTFYLYSTDLNELTLTSPTPEELLEANPLLFAKALMLRASLRFAAAQREGEYWVEFVPTYQDGDIKKFVFKIRKSDLLPLEIQMKETGKTTILRFKNASFEKSVPLFVVEKKDAFLNDMR